MVRVPTEDDRERTFRQSVIQDLALGSGLSEAEVLRIYDRELEMMQKSARIKDYVPLLVHRRVKQDLDRR
jgi:hypothetical protein